MCSPSAGFLKLLFPNCDFRENPRLGASNTPFTRWLPAEYADGISQPKGFNNQTVNNFILPLVRPLTLSHLIIFSRYQRKRWLERNDFLS